MNATSRFDDIAQLHALARGQMRSGQWQSAKVSLQSLLQQAPDNVEAGMEMANVLTRLGQWRDSIVPLLGMLDHLPSNAPLVLQLIQELIARGEVVAAREVLEFLARAPQPPVELLWSQAGLRYMLGEITQANDLLERALQAGADDADCHYLHGLLLKFMGCIDDARTVLLNVVQRWPTHGDAIVQLAELHSGDNAETLLARVDAQLGPDLSADADKHARFNRAQFQYARFRLLDGVDCDAAWEALTACNSAMHALRPYRPEATETLTEAILRAPVPKVVTTNDDADEAPIPIFIVGMPRSGTTLLEHMLSAHSQVCSAGEIVDFERQLQVMTNVLPGWPDGLARAIDASDDIDWHQLGRRYLHQTGWRARGRGWFIDKLPANIHLVGCIRRALPQARIVHLVRDPMDVCFSNFKAMFGSGSPYSYDMHATAHYYRQYARVAAHWHQHCPDAMLDVAYVDLVSNAQATMQRVLGHMGLTSEEACLHPERNASPVATPSSVQVREPIHQRGIGQWRRYSRQLQPLREALGVVED